MNRNVRNIMVALVIGMLLNILVAWVLKTVPQPPTRGELILGAGSHSLTVGSRPGFGFVVALYTDQSGDPIPIRDPRVPTWCRLRELVPGHVTSRLGFGWPLVSLWYSMESDLKSPTRVNGALVLGGDSGRLILPYRLAWPGFAVNTLAYGGACWTVLFGLGIVRRHHRHKRDLCTSCGYPLGSSTSCTECGTPLPNRGVA